MKNNPSGSEKRKSQFAVFAGRFAKNKAAMVGFVIIILLVCCALFPQLFTRYDPIKQVLQDRNLPPSAAHVFGTDDFGRDIFCRVVYGCRTSLVIGLSVVLSSSIVGIILGCIAGSSGSIGDNIVMRGMDILMAIPSTMLGISIVAAFGQSVVNLVIALSISMIAPMARLVRISVLSVKDQEYVEAAKSCGASGIRIMLRYILPNCVAPLIVQATMSIAAAIMAATALSFIGLGVPAPTPEWGSMASAARNYIRDYWWQVTFPGLAIMVTVFSFNLLGDGLRDALDPKLKN